jgi:hypothetical protein
MKIFRGLSTIRHKENDDSNKTPPTKLGRAPPPRHKRVVGQDLIYQPLPPGHVTSVETLPVPASAPNMSLRPFSGVNRTKIIIGLDFGTTYVPKFHSSFIERSFDFYPCHRFSGAAYTIQHPDDGPRKSNISIVRNWTGKLPGDVSSSKVPSVVAYDIDGKIIWGFEALHSSTRQKFQWVKLLLEPELSLKASEVMDLEEIKRLLTSQGRTAVQVASDFLKCLWEHVVAQICEDYGQGTFDFASKSIVLTVPAIWTPAARHNTFQVAAGAGLVCDDYDLQIISEPEAAAAAILKDRENVVKVCDHPVDLRFQLSKCIAK